jgi:hypothetical protein
MRRWLLVVAAIALVGVAAIRLAVTPTFVGGYRVIDDSTIALQVIGVSPTWRAVTLETETPSEVTVGVSEISLRFGPDPFARPSISSRSKKWTMNPPVSHRLGERRPAAARSTGRQADFGPSGKGRTDASRGINGRR